MDIDNIEDIVQDPEKYKDWVISLLETRNDDLGNDIINKLKNNEIDIELDLLLRQLGTIVPYTMLVPSFRESLGLTIQNDEECVKSLLEIRQYLDNEEEREIIDQIIEFVTSDEGELDSDIVPVIDLMAMVESVPIDKFSVLHNCIDYITEITE